MENQNNIASSIITINDAHADKNPANNMLLSKNISISINPAMSRRSTNTLVLGAAGAGKRRLHTVPNILNASYSFVVTDPAGETYEETKKALKEKGYDIQVLDLINLNKSMHFNPLAMLQQQYESGSEFYEASLEKAVKVIITSTETGGYAQTDFFKELERLILHFAINYSICADKSSKEVTFTDVISTLNKIGEILNTGTKEYEDVKKELGISEESLCSDLHAFFTMSNKTQKSAIIDCLVKLDKFATSLLSQITQRSNDKNKNIDFDKICQEKSALFVIVPTADTTYNLLTSMLITQLIDYCLYQREYQKENSPKTAFSHIQFFIDNFFAPAAVLDEKLRVIRNYNMGITLYFQNIPQIKILGQKKSDLIFANCDSFLYMSVGDEKTASFIISHSNIKLTDYYIDKICSLPDEECVVEVRGHAPVIDRKIGM